MVSKQVRTDSSGRPEWDRARMLDAWAACESGGEPAMPALGYPTGRRADPCGDESLAHGRLVRVCGYAKARPVLVHKHVKGLQLSDFAVCWPGETIEEALFRRCWQDFRVYETEGMPGLRVPVEQMAQVRYDLFMAALDEALRAEPFFGAAIGID